MSAPIKLYTLVAQDGQSGPIFSPHVWKAILDLTYLGVEFTTVNYTFVQIRNDLAKATGNPKITVPTIELPSGEFITESIAIAEYLEKNYAKDGKTLFGSPAGKAFARYIEQWVPNVLAADSRPLIIPSVIARTDAPNKDYFINVKLGSQEKYDSLLALNADSSAVSTKITNLQAHLKPFDIILRERASSSEGKFFGGEQPSHADFVLFGEYGFASVNPILKEQVWESDELAGIRGWVKALKESGLVDLKLLA